MMKWEKLKGYTATFEGHKYLFKLWGMDTWSIYCALVLAVATFIIPISNLPFLWVLLCFIGMTIFIILNQIDSYEQGKKYKIVKIDEEVV